MGIYSCTEALHQLFPCRVGIYQMRRTNPFPPNCFIPCLLVKKKKKKKLLPNTDNSCGTMVKYELSACLPSTRGTRNVGTIYLDQNFCNCFFDSKTKKNFQWREWTWLSVLQMIHVLLSSSGLTWGHFLCSLGTLYLLKYLKRTVPLHVANILFRFCRCGSINFCKLFQFIVQ